MDALLLVRSLWECRTKCERKLFIHMNMRVCVRVGVFAETERMCLCMRSVLIWDFIHKNKNFKKEIF